jgi:Fe2+ transport system protein B
MEKNLEKSVKEDSVKVVYHTEHVKLQDFGYAKSGSVQGDPEVYANYLDRILNGEIVDEKYKGLSDKDREAKRDKIKALEKVYEETAKNNAKFELDIKVKEKQIEEHRAELLQIREKRNDDHEKLLDESFGPFKFGINLFILLMLTGYLFFFYVSAAYKALYVDFEGIANKLAEGLSTGSIMPGPNELAEALRYNYLLFLVPFVFYAFGWAFHVILEMKQKTKFIIRFDSSYICC